MYMDKYHNLTHPLKWPGSRPDIVHIAGAVAVRPPKGLRLGLDLGVSNWRSNILSIIL